MLRPKHNQIVRNHGENNEKRNIMQMVRQESEWAANMIQKVEKKIQ